MATEIERKFLVGEPPAWLGDCAAQDIEQGYLAVGRDHEVRLRRREDDRILTVKAGHGRDREEREVELSAEQFDALWPLTEGRRVAKRRHRVEGEIAIDVDVYRGELEGLVTAEAEFPSDEASEAFEPPPWLGRELTGDDRYANQQLALSGLPG